VATAISPEDIKAAIRTAFDAMKAAKFNNLNDDTSRRLRDAALTHFGDRITTRSIAPAADQPLVPTPVKSIAFTPVNPPSPATVTLVSAGSAAPVAPVKTADESPERPAWVVPVIASLSAILAALSALQLLGRRNGGIRLDPL
jgi:hypothetical protein